MESVHCIKETKKFVRANSDVSFHKTNNQENTTKSKLGPLEYVTRFHSKVI